MGSPVILLWNKPFQFNAQDFCLYIPHPESTMFTLRFYRNGWWMHKRRQPKTRSNQGTMSCILTAAKKKGDIKKKKTGENIFQLKEQYVRQQN